VRRIGGATNGNVACRRFMRSGMWCGFHRYRNGAPLSSKILAQTSTCIKNNSAADQRGTCITGLGDILSHRKIHNLPLALLLCKSFSAGRKPATSCTKIFLLTYLPASGRAAQVLQRHGGSTASMYSSLFANLAKRCAGARALRDSGVKRRAALTLFVFALTFCAETASRCVPLWRAIGVGDGNIARSIHQRYGGPRMARRHAASARFAWRRC